MKNVGIDIGSSSVKLVIMDGGVPEYSAELLHKGSARAVLLQMLSDAPMPAEFLLGVTGAGCAFLSGAVSPLEEIPAIVSGCRVLCPDAGSIIEIGSQSSRFITSLDKKAPRFSVNEHCAGGTGSFFEAQMDRLGMKIEDISELSSRAQSIPRISGRCAVFAKTDIIHRQQEGAGRQDIILGLCYAMIRNYKAVIIRDLPIVKPVAFLGGVTRNEGVVRAIRDVFRLSDGELIIPENAVFASAVGAAAEAREAVSLDKLIECASQITEKSGGKGLEQLKISPEYTCCDPVASGNVDSSCYLGIDVGSTSTNLVIVDRQGNLADFQYLRTSGDPEGAVRAGLDNIRKKYGEIKFAGVGITGSGRERLGRMMGADAIRDEITAQARGAAAVVPDADTVFEIGGQDSKYISLKNGLVADFQMNKICAAGTGAFIEEQAARMNIPISEFGPLALTGENPCELGDRCTVFIETAISQAMSRGSSQADIAAGLCHSIVQNYLTKVVSGRPVGEKIVLQGGVGYNPGIVAAFCAHYGDRITLSPIFPVSGAYGAALLAMDVVKDGESTFLGFDFPSVERKSSEASAQTAKNREFYKRAGQIVLEDYDGKIDPSKKTVGVPLALVMYKFFPMVNAFFKNLGFNVVLSGKSDDETIRLSQQYATDETCYPVKLIYGHMAKLAQMKVDYIFMPSVRTIRHPHANAAHNYACPYMQVAPRAVFDSMKLSERGITLLNPVFDLDLGAPTMAFEMLDVGKELGFLKPRCMPGLLKGARAVMKMTGSLESMGKELLENLEPGEKVLVLITRNYGVSDAVLNMGIPELLLSRGYKVITLSHLPGMSLDLSDDYPNMYWPFGDHILSGAKLIANHPNLFAVYLTNHGCGPDTIVSHMFREEMGDKPYLQIEVDEHFSGVGVVTRIEAFLNSLNSHAIPEKDKDFNILNVKYKDAKITDTIDRDKTLFVPRMGWYTEYLLEYFREKATDVRSLPPFSDETLSLGRVEMNSKEYVTLPQLLGACLKAIEENGGDDGLQFFIPYGYGADADGQYARAVRTILDRRGFTNCVIVAPILEEISEYTWDFDLLLRSLITGDLVYMMPPDERKNGAPDHILTNEEIFSLASSLKERSGKRIAAVGDMLCLTGLDDLILDTLESEGYNIIRAPLAEALTFLWEDNYKLTDLEVLREVHEALGELSPYSEDLKGLIDFADDCLGPYAGNNGRYRFAKAVQMSKNCDAVLLVSPRYENTATALRMRGIEERCECAVTQLEVDGDLDDASWSRIRSFLHYC